MINNDETVFGIILKTVFLLCTMPYNKWRRFTVEPQLAVEKFFDFYY
jgi:hypothetical protein